jgi:hypothetical protein
MKYTYAERQKILQRAHETLRRVRFAEIIDGLHQERLELQREAAADRAFQQLQLARKRWLADHEQRQQKQPELIYKTIANARIINGRRC